MMSIVTSPFAFLFLILGIAIIAKNNSLMVAVGFLIIIKLIVNLP